MKKLLFGVLLIIGTTNCSKEKSAVNKMDSQHPNWNSSSATISMLTEQEIDESLRSTARAISVVIANNQNLIRLVHERQKLQFDGDYNALLKDIHQYAAAELTIDFFNDILSSADEPIHGSFLSHFQYHDGDDQYEGFPQIYGPNYDYLPEGLDKITDEEVDEKFYNSAPIVVYMPYFDGMAGDNGDEEYEGFKYVNGQIQSVLVTEAMMETELIWVISLNDLLALNDDGAFKRAGTYSGPFESDCSPLKKIRIKVQEIKILEFKERWASGKVQIYYSSGAYDANARYSVSEDYSFLPNLMGDQNQLQRPLLEPVSRKTLKSNVRNRQSNPLNYSSIFLNDVEVLSSWVYNCSDLSFGTVVIYEYDPWRRKKGIVPFGGEIFDYGDGKGTLGGVDYVNYSHSKDEDIDPANSDYMQIELPLRTAKKVTNNDRGRSIPYVIAVFRNDIANPDSATIIRFADKWTQPVFNGIQHVQIHAANTHPDVEPGVALNNLDYVYHWVNSGMWIKFKVEYDL